MTSVGNMIKRLEGLLSTSDLSAWESGFVEGVVSRTESGKHSTGELTEKQLAVIQRLHDKHFAS